MSLVKVDTQEAEKKLSLMRRYIFEIIVLALAGCVIFLFKNQRSIEIELRAYINNDRLKGIEIIQNNTNALQENTQVMKDVKDLLTEKQLTQTTKKNYK